MIKENIHQAFEIERFKEFQEALNFCTHMLSLPLFMVFSFADWYYAPDQVSYFLTLRTLIIPFGILVGFFSKRIRSINSLQTLGLVFAFINGFIITWMIHVTSGPRSEYYAGLNLVSLGILAFFPWSNFFTIATILVIFGPYYFLVLKNDLDPIDQKTLIINTFFIVGTIAASILIRMFRNRLKLRQIEAVEQLKEANVKISQISRMAEVGELSASVAHEIRSPLSAVGFAHDIIETILNKPQLGEPEITNIRKYLSQIQNSISFIHKIITNILIASGDPEQPPQLEKLDDIVQVAISMVGHSSTGKCKILSNIDPELRATLQKVQSIRCVSNLISNAVYVLYESKTPEPTIEISAQKLDNFALLHVKDNGPGIPKSVEAKIFKPFNTSKPAGKGVGLGLSMVKNMMIEMGGDITYQTSTSGTQFTLKFPIHIKH